MLKLLASLKEFAKMHERTFAFLWTITLLYLLAAQYMNLTLGG